MIIEEEAEPAEQIVELGAAQAFLRPWYLALGAGPGLVDEQREASLQEAPVEGGIVGDDQIGGRRPRGHVVVVELLAAQLVIGDAGEPNYLFVKRLAGILETGIAGQHVVEHALGGEVEGQARQLDDPVGVGLDPGGLDVDDHAEAFDGGGVVIGVTRHHWHTAQNAVVAALLQADGQLFQIGEIGHLNLRCRGP